MNWKSQRASSHTIQVDGCRVTAIQETYAETPAGLLTNAELGQLKERQELSLRGSTPHISISCFLVQSENRTVLIDGGLGGDVTPATGRLMPELEHLGVRADEVDTILLTHLHADHFGGLLEKDGALRFPKARLIAHELEREFCFENPVPVGNGLVQEQWTQAQRLRPHLERFEWVQEDQEVMPGIRLVHLPGHTPGHSGFLIGDGADPLMMWGDIVHQPLHQLADPTIGVAFDVDGVQAQTTRREVLRKVSEAVD